MDSCECVLYGRRCRPGFFFGIFRAKICDDWARRVCGRSVPLRQTKNRSFNPGHLRPRFGRTSPWRPHGAAPAAPRSAPFSCAADCSRYGKATGAANRGAIPDFGFLVTTIEALGVDRLEHWLLGRVKGLQQRPVDVFGVFALSLTRGMANYALLVNAFRNARPMLALADLVPCSASELRWDLAEAIGDARSVGPFPVII
jgi:hypothetical protein